MNSEAPLVVNNDSLDNAPFSRVEYMVPPGGAGDYYVKVYHAYSDVGEYMIDRFF